MTNEEIAIEKINDLIDDCNDSKYVKGTECDCLQYPCRLCIIKSALEENSKLKAEIEELQNQILCKDMIADELEIEKNNYFVDMCKEKEFCKTEKEQLKAEIEQLRECIENQKKLYEYRIDLQLEYSDRNHEEIERLKELMPKICETCEYEDEIGYEEPCNSCNNRRNWKLKSGE